MSNYPYSASEQRGEMIEEQSEELYENDSFERWWGENEDLVNAD